MMKKWIAIAAISALFIVPVALKVVRSDNAKSVEVEKAALRTLTPSILASGTLIYESQVTLASEVVGRVKEVLVKEGDFVTKGQLLLRLDAESSRAEIAQIEAGKRQSELNIERQQVNRDSQVAKWKRYEALRAQGMVEAIKYDDFVTQKDMAEVELRASREALKQTEAQLKQAQERLAKTEIRSPISGKVTAVYIKAGETAVPSATSIAGSNLMLIADTTSLYAEVNIDEVDVARIAAGQEAKIVPAAFPDKSLLGKVVQVAITPRQNPGQSKNYAVKIRLQDAPDVAFHPGMSCRAEVSTRKSGGEKSLTVPVQAVKYEEAEKKSDKAKASVLVFESGKAIKKEVEVGIADDSHIEILRGLKPDQEVISGPAKTLRFLRDGERVTQTTALPSAKPGLSQPADKP